MFQIPIMLSSKKVFGQQARKKTKTTYFYIRKQNCSILTASVESVSSFEWFGKKLSSNSKSPLIFVDIFLYFE